MTSFLFGHLLRPRMTTLEATQATKRNSSRIFFGGVLRGFFGARQLTYNQLRQLVLIGRAFCGFLSHAPRYHIQSVSARA